MNKILFKRDLIAATLTQRIHSQQEMQDFLTDILSPGEIEDIYNRLKVFSELAKKRTQREISKKLHVSISKVTRAANALRYGSGILYKIFGKPSR